MTKRRKGESEKKEYLIYQSCPEGIRSIPRCSSTFQTLSLIGCQILLLENQCSTYSSPLSRILLSPGLHDRCKESPIDDPSSRHLVSLIPSAPLLRSQNNPRHSSPPRTLCSLGTSILCHRRPKFPSPLLASSPCLIRRSIGSACMRTKA